MADESEKLRKVTARGILIAIIFISIIQAISFFITKVNTPVIAQSGFTYTPLGTSPSASVGNSFLLVLTVFASTLVLVWFIKRGKTTFFKFIAFAATSIVLFTLTLLTVDSTLSSYLADPTLTAVEVVLAVAPVLALVYATYFGKIIVISVAVLALLSAEAGSYFGSTFPPPTGLILPIAFAFYDVYAVFKGPLKQLISVAPPDVLSGVSVKVGDFTLGLGDTVFYSMLPSLALYQGSLRSYQFGLSSFLAAAIAVDVGVLITLTLLAKRRVLPGLPIPMGLGVAAILLLQWFA
jgi:hypothetical protein